MKKYLVLMLLAVACALPTQAQIKFGLTAGVNMTNVSLSDLPASVKSRTGFFVGPMIKFTVPVIGLSIDAAALYDQREGKAEANGISENIKSQSVQIPINLRYGWGLGASADIFLFAGPQFGFNVGGKKVIDSAREWTLRSSNLSANVGIGATLLGHLQAKFNYNFALGKTGEIRSVSDANRAVGKAKFNAWQLSLAYLF